MKKVMTMETVRPYICEVNLVAPQNDEDAEGPDKDTEVCIACCIQQSLTEVKVEEGCRHEELKMEVQTQVQVRAQKMRSILKVGMRSKPLRQRGSGRCNTHFSKEGKVLK